MAIDYHDSYLGQMRALIGKKKMFSIAARGIVLDENGRLLLVRRSDNGLWVMPAGSIELEESIFDCLKREVWEETGLIVDEAQAIAIYSESRFSFITSYGDPYQMFTMVFLVEKWHGELQTSTDETVDARFFPLDDLPEIPDFYHETVADLADFRQTGQFIVK